GHQGHSIDAEDVAPPVAHRGDGLLAPERVARAIMTTDRVDVLVEGEGPSVLQLLLPHRRDAAVEVSCGDHRIDGPGGEGSDHSLDLAQPDRAEELHGDQTRAV